jgi:hypothetical protein
MSDEGSDRAPARPTRRRLLAGTAGAVTAAGLASVMKPAPAGAVAPHVLYMVKNNGDLIRRTDYGAVRKVGWGWQPARLLAGLDDNRFIEVKEDGRLWEWVWDGENLNYTHRGQGWQTARLIAGLDSDHFLEVKVDGRLAWWYRSGATFAQQIRGSDWTIYNTRQISGASSTSFYEVRGEDGGISLWTYNSGSYTERSLPGLTVHPLIPATISGISGTKLWYLFQGGLMWHHTYDAFLRTWKTDYPADGDPSDVRLITT